jgi:hypothetical protein
MTENLKPKETSPESPDERQHRLELKRYRVEKWTLFFLFVYVSVAAYQGCEMRESVRIAHDTFIAANKPSVGVNGISIVYTGVGPQGQRIESKVPTQQTNNFSFQVEIKNFGQVSADDFLPTTKVFLDGKEQPGELNFVRQTSTIFPGKSVYFAFGIGSQDYPSIVNGKKILELEVTVHYAGPGKTYNYCEKYRYGAPNINAFFRLGTACAP